MIAYSPAANFFLMYALLNAFLLKGFLDRFLQSRAAGPGTLPPTTYRARMFGRLLFVIISIFLVGDNIRIFSGGFWTEEPTAPKEGEMHMTPVADVPTFARSFKILLFSHLVLVPLLVMSLAEAAFTIPTYLNGHQFVEDHEYIKKLRPISVLLALGLAALGFFNYTGEIAAIEEFGFEANNLRGIITYTSPNETLIFEEGGHNGIPGTALLGVIGMSAVACAVGALLWYKTGYATFFIINVLCLLGQGGGPMFLGADFAFLSNFLEAVLFISMTLLEQEFWPIPSEVSNSFAQAKELEP